MALTTNEKWGWGIGLGAALIGLACVLKGSDEDELSTSGDDDDEDELRPGRAHELDVLLAMDRAYPRREVLDNPTFELEDGSRIRPDAVVLNRDGEALEVREAKDVAQLRSDHVYQAFGYDMALEPERGTTLDIAAHTDVPDHVEELAEQLGILLNRLL